MRREILVEGAAGETRIAVLEDDLLAEMTIERPGDRGVVGNIYKGRVHNVLPGMQSAFVDIGLERDAFLHVEDLSGPAHEEEAPSGTDREGEPLGEAAAARLSQTGIEDFLREGQEIVVQVSKDSITHKGARITAGLSLPGRFLVFLPHVQHVGVSRRITDPVERERLKAVIEELVRDQGLPGGFIVRTAGERGAAAEFLSDARYLHGLWEEIRRRAESSAAPALLHREVGAMAKVLRDVLGRDVQRVLIDTTPLHREAMEFVGRVQPDLVSKIHLYAGAAPIFDEHGVQPQLDRALRPRAWLKSGGSIVINQTEALVAIDVNTGKYVGRRRLEETILKTNLEAVREIVRQIRLRDLGGIIVIDFIDMEEAASRHEVIQALESELEKDRSRSRMQPISEFGLVEITRQRTRRSLERLMCAPCPSCGGSGFIRSPDTVFHDVLREIRRQPRSLLSDGPIVVRVHPEVAVVLEERRQGFEEILGAPLAARLVIRADPNLLHSQYSVAPA
ncbi:MAG TPA: Rne/Rng family ribonuclease [Candidatus Polarisedimenticolia bacterium]|nr:Rne/Rng family ribonuclease [Candidatus Polarisedimenticolia bacterium]